MSFKRSKQCIESAPILALNAFFIAQNDFVRLYAFSQFEKNECFLDDVEGASHIEYARRENCALIQKAEFCGTTDLWFE
jgi:hypothetical protein